MKNILILICLVSNAKGLCQKPILDTTAIKNWTHIRAGMISSNGQYVCFTNERLNSEIELTVTSVDRKWHMSFRNAKSAQFSADGLQIVFKIGQDSLVILTLGVGRIEIIEHVVTFKMGERDGSQWLAYMDGNPERGLIVRDLATKRENSVPFAREFHFDPSCENIIVIGRLDHAGDSTTWIRLVNLATRAVKTVWRKRHATVANLVAGPLSSISFVSNEQMGNRSQNVLWLYNDRMDIARILVSTATSGVEPGMDVANLAPEFTSDGRFIFFGLQDSTALDRDLRRKASKLEIWSYLDEKPEPVLEEEEKYSKIYPAAISISAGKVVRLGGSDESVVGHGGKWVLIRHGLGYSGLSESGWNASAEESFFLVDIENGARTLLKDHIKFPLEDLSLSPSGKWVFYYDLNQNNYFSYNTTTHTIRNVSLSCHTQWINIETDYPEHFLEASPGLPKWLNNDEWVLVRDRYDIWKINASGKRPPINLTNGYGRKRHIRFSLIDTGSFGGTSEIWKSRIPVQGVDENSQDRGFFSIAIPVRGGPRLLSMGPYVYGEWRGHGKDDSWPIKAKNSECYLMLRMNAVEAPNYFVSKDLRHFVQISDNQPQREYNWLTDELIGWKTLDGTYTKGILYKPENFNPGRKYPVIFDYYEVRSDEVNLFIPPALSSSRINIPWFVSRGYLVLVPDIHYKIGYPGLSAYNSVVSAAEFLSRRPYVDRGRMGIQGHSFGGYETNYIVSHSRLFAAACSCSGLSDLVSFYGAIARGSYPMYWSERSQGRIGTTPWAAPELYISNSPIFAADRVTTPLLLMHNKGDALVPFAQSVEFFSALRRLGKRVWLLQYDGSDHFIEGWSAQEDFTMRMTQFFDHYLRGLPAPVWMAGKKSGRGGF